MSIHRNQANQVSTPDHKYGSPGLSVWITRLLQLVLCQIDVLVIQTVPDNSQSYIAKIRFISLYKETILFTMMILSLKLILNVGLRVSG